MSHKFHGIALALNSAIENAVFEQLAATPADLVAGRIWFNTTDNTFNFTDIDGVGAIRVNTFASAAALAAAVSTLNAAVAAETARAQAAESAETTRATAAEVALGNSLNQEISDRTAADAAEVTARQAGDATVTAAFQAADAVVAQNAADALAAEASSRATDDAALGGRIDGVVTELQTVQTSAGLNNDGTYTAPQNTSFLGSTTSLRSADIALDAAIVAETARAEGVEANLSAAIEAETQRALAAEGNLTTQLESWVQTQLAANQQSDVAETAARIAGDASLQSELDATQLGAGLSITGEYVVNTAGNYIAAAASLAEADNMLDAQAKANADAIVAEAAARTSADATFQNQLSTEITERTAADTNLQNELNATQVGAGLHTDGSYVNLTGSNYLDTATSLSDADSKLDGALKSVDARVGTLETDTIPAIQTALTAETTRATAAENDLRTLITSSSSSSDAAVTAEATRALAAEADLQAQITAEATRATGIEGGLQSQVNTVVGDLATEVAARQAGDTNLQNQIDNLVAASGDGANALKLELNAGRYAFTSASPALVHIVTTNLGTLDCSVDLKVQGTDSIWRNDIAPIEFAADGNSFTVTLSEASNIKASGQSNAQLA